MPVILTSLISMILLLGVIIFLFWKLKDINGYNVILYLFLASFWIIMSFVRKSISATQTGIPHWGWPLIFASYQFAQVATRIPLGILSRKLKSRQVPIILSTVLMTVSVPVLVATNFSAFSICLAAVFTGVFGATFGIQNQYWSENFNIRQVFMTVALVSILPSMGALVGTLAKATIDEFNPQTLRWILAGSMILMIIITSLFYIWPERKETIRLDNEIGVNETISKLKLKDVFVLTGTIVFISLGFNMVTSGGSFQDNITSEVEITPIILTIVAIVTALFTSLYLVQKIKAYTLTIVAHALLIIGFLVGIAVALSGVRNIYINLWYLIILAIGFNLYQNTVIGVAIHFDHKNSLLVLGIWLTIRSLSIGTGQVIGGEIIAFTNDAMKWMLVGALGFSVASLLYSILTYKKWNKKLFDITDHYEFEVDNSLFSKTMVNSRKKVVK